ncbi:hypothetical protein SUGI_0793680 [Cryptomeria japonica]|nr:hypothetical protein SUGI_0793680 [Cryptomeria japonica]
MVISMLCLRLAVVFALTTATAVQNVNTSCSPYDVFALHHPQTEGRFSVAKDEMMLHKVDHEQRDVEALLAFKHGITSDPMRSFSNWNSTNSENVCLWNGVWCRKHNNRLVAIILMRSF